MTEKIFTFHGIDATTIEVYENGGIIAEFCHSMTCANGVEILCNRLNKQHEENKELKQQLDDSIEMLHKEITSSENAFEGLLKEKEQLKKEINILRGALGLNESYTYGRLLKENKHLEQENEQFKKEYKKLKHRHGLLHDECLEQEIKIDNLKQWKKEVFEIIDEKLEEAKHLNFQYSVLTLEKLKKEIES